MSRERSSITNLVKLLVLSGAFMKVAAQAQASLFIPGFDPQPISADVIGVDEEGRTTWALQAGQATDPAEIGIPPSATITLVEGPSNAGYTFAFTGDSGTPITVAYDCSLSGDQAVCNGFVGGESGTMTTTQDPFLVQVGTTAAATAPLTAKTAATTSGASTGSGVPSQTTSGSGARETNGSEQMKASVKVLTMMAIGLSGLLYHFSV